MRFQTVLLVIYLFSFFALTCCNPGGNAKKRVTSADSSEVVHNSPAEDIPIHQAALDGNFSQVSMLLERGTDVNQKDADNRTALMYAAFNGHIEIMKVLMKKGADLNLCDNYGRTALMMASSGTNPAAVKLLLDNQADPNLADKEEHFTAIMYAAAEGQLEVVKILISYRADPTLKDIDGDDALIFAVNNNHKEVAQFLRSIKK
jgi:uncharacterized protein